MKKLILCILSIMLGIGSITAQSSNSRAHQSSKHARHAEVSYTNRQEHDTRFWAGGSLSYWHDYKTKTNAIALRPEFGYLLTDKFGIGSMLGFVSASEQSGETTRAFNIAPFARYYYYGKGPFNLYLDGGFGLGLASTKSGVGNTWVNGDLGFEIGLRPGACLDLTPGLCLCLRLGFIGYRKNYGFGEEEMLGNNGFGARFAPEELMIGLEFEF